MKKLTKLLLLFSFSAIFKHLMNISKDWNLIQLIIHLMQPETAIRIVRTFPQMLKGEMSTIENDLRNEYI